MYQLLVVDDEFEIRNGISHYFPWSELGFVVAGEAENGKDALDFIRDHPVDAVLCDIKMPLMSGLEFAKALHERKHAAKVVFLTGYKDFELVKEALVYGARNYIVKPTKYQELANVFHKIKEELDEEGRAGRNGERTGDYLISQIKDFVAEHYKTVQLKDVAEVVHMNPYYLSTLFKKKTGQPFSDYVLSVKMETAAKHLRNPANKTYEVSEWVGYSNPKNFSNAFKAYFGKSPRQFRGGE
ncbi:response regulator transcription factor [Cohnella cellulosilytica]|uniref:Response regulator n=1 Tax=Cohnella cellulosilytica TaxID=986710 RepID=A0ABW2F4P3_9BACL